MMKWFIKLLSVVLMFCFTPYVCFAQVEQNEQNTVKFQKIIANMKNESANFISTYHNENIILAKILRDAHIAAMPYNVNLETVNNVEKFYIDLQFQIADLKGDISSLSKKQIADSIIFSTSLYYDAECIAGYSILDALLGSENINKIKQEGINSVCAAFTAYTCHDKYSKKTQAEQKQLLEFILNYDYDDNILAITNALIAINNVESTTEIQNWKQNILNKIVDFYKEDGWSTQRIANVVTCAMILGIDIDNDSRFIKQGNTIIDTLYNEVQRENIKQAQYIEDVLTAFVYYQTKQNPYYYGNYNLKQNHNQITTEVYQYLLNKSDISKHWSKQNFVNMILNGYIKYDYNTEKNVFPDKNITRGEFISFIFNTKNIENTSEQLFYDINNSIYKNEINSFMKEYITTKFISISEKQSFLNLYFGENFRPNDNITREEAAFFIKCASGYANKLQPDNTENLKTFIDYNDCDEKYIDMLEFCVKRGFISGRDGKLLPKQTLTRAEAVTLITNFNQYH
ncbi:S-layer homology domain-containing protein [Clostridium sp. MD294]|uniref:S-layer homology domain-containing protein n=1 Tax=Clostridium sp. MD294 TaxID=97138 RepID=UPI0002CBA238|nr:S-layer homology domain-containing protein [Clostridium sp. MD294]USF30820.1 hypothetical protein C820_002264 [Clostridium sp. MD294]